jgi:hypothetical protein
MIGEGDRDLPLHDEAEARAKWRGGETIVDKGDGGAGPASEIDNAAQGGEGDGAPAKDIAQSPPD